jgi:hypothetical protein
MTASIPPQKWWMEVWYMLTGKHYEFKRGD